eukprot:1158180-Pelagomonas_calceolata.AAC.6
MQWRTATTGLAGAPSLLTCIYGVMTRVCCDESLLQLWLVMGCQDTVLAASLSQPDNGAGSRTSA